MKKIFVVLSCIIITALFGLAGITGCGGSSGSSSEAASSASDISFNSDSDDNKDETSSETTAEAEIKAAEDGDEFHVGDEFLIGDMKIVYMSSSEYISDNQFIQPQEGYKYICLHLYCENTGSSDESVSCFDFNCYADGYSMDQVYLDDSLSASLSAGRTAEGSLYYEVPADAAEIMIEHSVSLFSSSNFSLIYEGEMYSDFVAETNASVSENAYNVGQTAEGDLAITYSACYQYYSENEFIQPREGYRFLTFEFEVENTSSTDQTISSLSFQCYADGVKCDGCYARDDELSATLSSGKKAAGTVSFEVPEGASVIEVEYESNVWTSEKIIFLYSE